MEIIEELGMVANKSGNKYRMNRYRCPQCGKIQDLCVHNVKKSKYAVCATCIVTNRNTSHGLSGEKFYNTWNNMMARCYRKSSKNFKNWGGRGITVCKAWHEPIVFKEWFDSNYIDGFQIDREDNDGNYEPSNCRFVSASENINNSSPKLSKIGKYRYVVWKKRTSSWEVNYKGAYIGCHKDEEEAYHMLEKFKGKIK